MPNIIDPVKVGNKIKSLLKEHKMTQDDLANKLYITKSAVSQNLRGRSTFDIQNLIKISQIFNITLDNLLELGNDNLMEVSVYKNLINKDITWFDNNNVNDLRLFDPDLYGNVFVEYLIENNNLELFNYLNDKNIMFVNNNYYKAKDIYLKVIIYMFKNNLNPIKYIRKYVFINKNFDIKDENIERQIWTFINNLNDPIFYSSIINNKVNKKEKLLFFNINKNLSIISLNKAFEISTKYHLDNFLLYVSKESSNKTYINYFKIIKNMLENNYKKGIYIFNDEYFDHKKINQIHKTILNFNDVIKLIIESKNIELIKYYVNKEIYINIYNTIEVLILNDLTEYAYELIEEHNKNIVFKDLGLILIKDNKNAIILKKVVKYFTQEELDFLLGMVDESYVDIIKVLIKANARFNLSNLNSSTFRKMNNILDDDKKENDDGISS